MKRKVWGQEAGGEKKLLSAHLFSGSHPQRVMKTDGPLWPHQSDEAAETGSVPLDPHTPSLSVKVEGNVRLSARLWMFFSFSRQLCRGDGWFYVICVVLHREATGVILRGSLKCIGSSHPSCNGHSSLFCEHSVWNVSSESSQCSQREAMVLLNVSSLSRTTSDN